MGFIILPLLALVLLFWGIFKYNSFMRLKNEVANAWTQIDIQIRRRHDLIPNFVNIVKGYMEFEQDTLRQVIEARAAAVGAKGIAEAGMKEGELSGVLSRLFSLTENYPELKADAKVKDLEEEITSTENKISFSRQFYNDLATKFNIAQQVFPGNMMTNMLSLKPVELFRIQKAEEREVPAVNLLIRKS